MKVLVVGRTLPHKKSTSLGLFEYQQAAALNEKVQAGYLFTYTGSILQQHKFGIVSKTEKGLPIQGTHFPMKGLPRFLFNPIQSYIFKRAYRSFVRKNWKPDIIHFHFPLLVINQSIIRYLKEEGIPFVCTEHWSKVAAKKLNKYEKNLLKATVDAADRFICVSHPLKESVEALTGHRQLEVLPNMVDKNIFCGDRLNKNNQKNFRFTFIGRLVSSKRVDLLIPAFQKAFADQPTVFLDIIGDGPVRKSLEGLVEPDFRDRILFHGQVPHNEIRSKLLTGNCFVSASNQETFGVPFIEAMALGLPVIGADNLPITEYIGPENGILFKTDCEEDLTAALVKMASTAKSYDSDRIRQMAIDRFSPEKIVDSLVKTYQSLVE